MQLELLRSGVRAGVAASPAGNPAGKDFAITERTARDSCHEALTTAREARARASYRTANAINERDSAILGLMRTALCLKHGQLLHFCGTIPRMTAVIIVAVIVIGSYFLSLRVHPWRRCRSCKGTGRQFGAVWKHSHRLCSSCGGNGRRARIGVQVFYGNRQTWGERAPAEASARRSRNLGR